MPGNLFKKTKFRKTLPPDSNNNLTLGNNRTKVGSIFNYNCVCRSYNNLWVCLFMKCKCKT